MTTDTYQMRFNEHLQDVTTEAGSFQRIIALAAIYLGLAPSERRLEFVEWAERTRFDCAGCGRIFELRSRTVEEEEPVLCLECERR
jgi:hypothetical protein